MDVRAVQAGTAVDEARRRWRAAGDRLWPVACSDGEAYRALIGQIGPVLAELRRRAHSMEDLLRVDADPESAWAGPASGPGLPGGVPRPVVEAACAVRADEIDAADARRDRADRVRAARAAGATWATVQDAPGCVVEMHLGTGLALVATADPMAGPQPYGLAEVALDAVTAQPLAEPARAETSFASREEWRAARAARRAEIEGVP